MALLSCVFGCYTLGSKSCAFAVQSLLSRSSASVSADSFILLQVKIAKSERAVSTPCVDERRLPNKQSAAMICEDKASKGFSAACFFRASDALKAFTPEDDIGLPNIGLFGLSMFILFYTHSHTYGFTHILSFTYTLLYSISSKYGW